MAFLCKPAVARNRRVAQLGARDSVNYADMGPQSPATGKDAARQHFRAARLAMAPEERAKASAGLRQQVEGWLLPGSNRPGLIAAYLSVDPEPGTLELLASLAGSGYEVVVPICESAYQLSWCRWSAGVELRRSPRAPVLEPVGERRHFTGLLTGGRAVSLLLVPALAVDRSGSRLGQGGGYYDRFLAQLRAVDPAVPTLGYVYDHELLPAGTLAATPLDMPLAGAFTPSAFHRLETRRDAV